MKMHFSDPNMCDNFVFKLNKLYKYEDLKNLIENIMPSCSIQTQGLVFYPKYSGISIIHIEKKVDKVDIVVNQQPTFESKTYDMIHNFVDLKRFNKKPLAAFKKVVASHDEKIVVHASNFRKIKRIGDVMEIFKNIHAATSSKLLMVGDGPERPIAEDLARQYGIESDVRFLGKQEQMEDILAVSDLFLLPSEYESFGLVALEAMASSVAVISSNAGGLGEINIDGQTGYTADVGDVATMSERAIHLLKDDAQLKAFKHNALEQAKLFDIHHIIPMYEKLYRRFCRTGDC
jgi:N-acetyl-alpha-D-glucosaminyl L-malate synthase BshA